MSALCFRLFVVIFYNLRSGSHSDINDDDIYHRLRGSASPVLTATPSFLWESETFELFFPLGSGGQTLQRPFTQNGSNDVFSRKDVPFAVKVATFHTP